MSKAFPNNTVIRFDGPPSHESGRFVEVEQNGASIKYGEWHQDGDDWLLVLPGDIKHMLEPVDDLVGNLQATLAYHEANSRFGIQSIKDAIAAFSTQAVEIERLREAEGVAFKSGVETGWTGHKLAVGHDDGSEPPEASIKAAFAAHRAALGEQE